MKLYVDDIRNAPDESWTVARTVSSAIRALAMFGSDITDISLDHDISHQVTIGSLSRPYPCHETFQPVAYFIGEKYFVDKALGSSPTLRISSLCLPPKITLHTSNPTGAIEMQKILEGYGLESEIKPMGLANRLEMEV